VPNYQQDIDFAETLIDSNRLLDKAIAWIETNLSVDAVFTENELLSWARDRRPDDIFRHEELSAWAEANGYIKE
jgi:hypothetical protein